MRDRLPRLLSVVLVLVSLWCLPALAAGGPPDGGDTATVPGKVLEPSSMEGRARVENVQVQWVPRGTDWWPYLQQAPYTALADVNEVNLDLVLIEDIAHFNIRNRAEALSQVPKELLSTLPEGSPEQYSLLKFSGPVQQEWIDDLKAQGVQFFTFFKWYTYAVRIPADKYKWVKNQPFVSWVGNYEPAYKIDRRIGTVLHPQEVAGPGMPFVLEVSFFEDQDPAVAEAQLLNLGCAVRDRVINEFQLVLIAEVRGELIPEVARIPGVKYMVEWAEPMLRANPNNEENPVVLQVGPYLNTAAGHVYRNNLLDGTGQRIAMMDEGLDVACVFFSNLVTAAGTPGASHRKVQSYTAYGSGDLCNCSATDMSHGTWTSTMAMGNISTFGYPKYDFGVANNARVVFQDIAPIADCTSGAVYPPADLTASMTQAQTDGAFVQNHSWGAAANTYSTHTGQLDTFLFNNRNFMVTCSAGNSGLASLDRNLDDLATGKNVIACGGNDQDPNETELFADSGWGLGSGRGPVNTSNRTKPDVLFTMADSAGTAGNASGEAMAGPAGYIQHCSPWSGTPALSYVANSGLGGTSFSAPMVAGAASVIRQYFTEGWYPTGLKVPANALTPSGMLLKAMLIASAQNMDLTDSPNGNAVVRRYSSDVGYGRIQLDKILPLTGITGPTGLVVEDNKSLTTGNTHTYNYIISGNANDVKVALVWYDKSGNTLQIDYDLEVTLGSVYKGNQFGANGFSTPGTTVDHTNSTEAVFLPAGGFSAGYMTVKVYATNAPAGDSPTYALVVTGNIAPPGTKGVYLNRSLYDCNDSAGITVIDEGAGSSVLVNLTVAGVQQEAVTISGAAPAYSTTINVVGGAPIVNNGILEVLDGNAIQARYTDSTAVLRTSDASAKCTYNLCLYWYGTPSAPAVDELIGGCDDDPFHDQGERLQYWLAVQNNDTVGLQEGFTARLRAKAGSDPNGYLNFLQDWAYFAPLDPTRARYMDPLYGPFLVEYNGPIASTCDSTLTFELFDIRSASDDGLSWTGVTTCGATNEFTETANWSYGATILEQKFETWPATGWTVVNNGGDCIWDSTANLGNPNYTGGSGEAASADADSCGNGTTMDTTLTSPTFSLAGVTAAMLEYKTSFDDYSGTSTATLQIYNGSGWVNLTAWVAADVPVEGKQIVDLTPYVGTGTRQLRWVYTADTWEWFWQVDDVKVHAGPEACQATVCTPAPDLQVADWAFDDNDCNGDGWIDVGEVGELTIYLDNVGNDYAWGTTATLSTTTTGVTVCDTSAGYGDIPFGTGYIWGAGLNTFTIAVDPTVTCLNSVIDFSISLNSTNPYSVVRTFQLPLGSFQNNSLYYQDQCGLQPETAGTTGRTGFSDAWTVSTASRTNVAAATTDCANDDGNNSVWTNSGVVTMDHVFSTVGSSQEVTISWAWDVGTVATLRSLAISYSTTGLAGPWTQIVSSPGTNVGAPEWECWSGGLLASTGDPAVLNNANLAIRFSGVANARFDNIQLQGIDRHCTATSCTGICPAGASPPPMPGNGVTGNPFRIVKNSGTPANVDCTWDGTTCAATNYQVLWGNISSLSLVSGVTNGTVTAGTCGHSGSGATNQDTPDPTPGQCFFAVVDAVSGTSFGRHGNNTAGNERVFSGDTTPCSGTKDITMTSCARGESEEVSGTANPFLRIPRQDGAGPVQKATGTVTAEAGSDQADSKVKPTADRNRRLDLRPRTKDRNESPAEK